MQSGYQLLRQCLSNHEVEHWLGLVQAKQEIFRSVGGRGGLNLPYSVVDGRHVREHFPELVELAETRLRDIAQQAVGQSLQPIQDPKRAIRLQLYRGREEGFKWHLDVSPYSALLTLTNSNRSATEVISPTRSRWLKPLYFSMYPIRQLLSWVRHETIVSDAGDLLMLHGTAALHRACAFEQEGERLVLVAVFEPVGSRPNRFLSWLARTFNY